MLFNAESAIPVTVSCATSCATSVAMYLIPIISHHFINLSNIYNILPYAQGSDLS